MVSCTGRRWYGDKGEDGSAEKGQAGSPSTPRPNTPDG